MDPPLWSNVVKAQLPPLAADHHSIPPPTRESQATSANSFKSSIGVSIAVVDANAVIDGAEKLHGMADRFVTVPEVLSEIRDPMSRHRMELIPYIIQPLEPTAESLAKVVKFARATGDLQTLSDVDLKLIALTYMLEVQTHGIARLRDAPPPVKTVNVKRLPESKMPGWGCSDSSSGWEILEDEGAFQEENAQTSSRILPMKSIHVDISESLADIDDTVLEPVDDVEQTTVVGNRIFPSRRVNVEEKKTVDLTGKKMVAAGVDASMGQDDIGGEWSPAVNRGTRRRFLRRKAKFEYFQSLSKDCDQNGNVEEDKENVEDGISNALEKMVLEEVMLGTENGETLGKKNQALEESNESCDTSIGDEDGSSQSSWMLRSLSDSSVACVTNDFAMQNVLIQMGLRLLSPGGNTIRQLHRWVLKCHACFTVTSEIGRIFCPKCGNGGTLRKVAVTVNESGIVLTSRTPRIILRGTKFSLPLPQGGRDAISKNFILREDQLPQKFLHPKAKKKSNKEGDDFVEIDRFFSPHAEKNGPFRPNMRKTVAVYNGRRNPNDNHYSIRKH